MRKRFFTLLVLGICLCALFMVVEKGRAQKVNCNQAKGMAAASRELNSPGNIKVDVDFAKIPLYFISNQGQVNAQARFYAKARRYTLWVTKEGLVFDSARKQGAGGKKQDSLFTNNRWPMTNERLQMTKYDRDVCRLLFIGANKNPSMKAVKPAALKVNYFIGNDRSKWRCDVPTSLAVQYENLYQDIDLQVYGVEKQIEYDWVVKPGGNPAVIKFEYKGIKSTRIDSAGNLVIKTRFGELVHKKPVSYQVCSEQSEGGGEGVGLRAFPGERKYVDVRFKKVAENSYGFAVGAYDKSRYLIIDPLVLLYSTYLGGSNDDIGYGIAVDDSGNVYVTGWTGSTDFPILDQYQADQDDDNYDVFVVKLDTTQSGDAGLLYSTYLGGGSGDWGYGIAADGSGNAYLTGWTESTDFPTVNQYQADQGDDNRDVFVAKLDTTQSGAAGLVYSTYLGGGSTDWSEGIAVDGSGNVYVTGSTNSTDFPILNQYQADQGDDNRDVFVAKLDTTQSGAASLLYSTYLGGGRNDDGRGIAIDDSGNVYVTGGTGSLDFPILNQYQSLQRDGDAFVTKLDTTQSGAAGLIYSTYLGGGRTDGGYGIAVDGSGCIYVTGETDSFDFPILNQYQSSKRGDGDVFVAKLDPSKSGAASLLYSTYLGGGLFDMGFGIAVDCSGNVYVAGHTYSTDFPILNQYQSDQGYADDFVAKLDPSQSGAASLLCSTYLGGGSNDYGCRIAIDGSGNAYLTGYTLSSDFPTLDQYQEYQGFYDAFVAKLSFGAPPIVPPTVDSPTSAAVLYTTADLGGNVSNTNCSNVTERGVYWSTTDGFTPPGQGTEVSETGNWGTGTFTVYVTGLPTGTPIYFKAFATNTAGVGYSAQASFTTLVVTIPDVTTTAISNITSTSADSGGNVTSDGGADVTARGVCWSTSENPTTADSTTSNGSGIGAFTSNITELTPGATYHVRAYATNSVGTSYGSDISFATSAVVPTVTTAAISNITSTSADSGGNVTYDGGAAVTARGVCWSTSENPTTADSFTTDGSGTGTFTSSITGLNPGTTYHVRAYATNSVGTSYGSDISFATSAVVPTVTTAAISNITSTSADSGGNVTYDGGAAVTARGVCWSTSENPTTADSFTTDGSGTGPFTSSITSLYPLTTYHVRAYATNIMGTSYGIDVSFTTTAGIAIISPDGGENWKLSSIQNITWNAAGLSALLKITLWKNDVWLDVIADNVDPAAGFYAWTVGTLSSGSMAAPGSDYKIKIKEIGTAIAHISDADFTLSPGITVIDPNDGQTWKIGSVKQITWISGGLTNEIKISLFKDGALVGVIATVAPTGGSYTWKVGKYIGGTAAAGAGYRIKIKEINTSISDESDAAFQLTK